MNKDVEGKDVLNFSVIDTSQVSLNLHDTRVPPLSLHILMSKIGIDHGLVLCCK